MSRIAAAVVAVAVFVAVAAIVPGAGSYAMFEDVESVTVGFSTDVSASHLDVVELEPMEKNASLSGMAQPAVAVGNNSSEDTNGSILGPTPGTGAVDLPPENGTVDESANATVDQPQTNVPANGSAPGVDSGDNKPPGGVSPLENPPDVDESSSEPDESAPGTPTNVKSGETPGSDSGDGDPTTEPETPGDSADTSDDTESEGTDVGVDEPAPPEGTSESSGQDLAGDNGHPETDDENGEPEKPSVTGGDSHSETSPGDETAAADTDTSSSSEGLGSGDPSSGDSTGEDMSNGASSDGDTGTERASNEDSGGEDTSTDSADDGGTDSEAHGSKRTTDDWGNAPVDSAARNNPGTDRTPSQTGTGHARHDTDST